MDQNIASCLVATNYSHPPPLSMGTNGSSTGQSTGPSANTPYFTHDINPPLPPFNITGANTDRPSGITALASDLPFDMSYPKPMNGGPPTSSSISSPPPLTTGDLSSVIIPTSTENHTVRFPESTSIVACNVPPQVSDTTDHTAPMNGHSCTHFSSPTSTVSTGPSLPNSCSLLTTATTTATAVNAQLSPSPELSSKLKVDFRQTMFGLK